MKTLGQVIKEFMLLRASESNLYDASSLYYVKNVNNNLERLVYLINETLTKIYTDYPILQKNVLIEFTAPYLIYKLRPEFAVTSSSNEIRKYIKDSVYKPFYGNVVKILSVSDADGVRLPMNMYNDMSSVFLLEPDVIQFSGLNKTINGTGSIEYFDVCYQAKHVPLIVGNYETQYITLPDVLYEIFYHYLAFKFLSIFQTKGHAVESQKNYLIYNDLKNILETNGTIYSIEQGENNTLDKNGFF